MLNNVTWRSFHKWATLLWSTVGLVLSWLFRDSLVWIVFMSLWANVVGHWSAYQAARAEETNDGTYCTKCQAELEKE